MQRIGLIDCDGHNFPNLPLMKLSAYHKQQGDFVDWYCAFDDEWDVVYVSKVFSFSQDYDFCINAKKVIRGGSGYAIKLVNGKEVYDKTIDDDLPYHIEHIMPDYSLYPKFNDTAYGFLTRGCPRACSFCHVVTKEGRKSVKVADLSEFWNGQKEICLCDPNLLACADWRDCLEQLQSSKARIDFNQGLDIRLMSKEKAQMLAKLRIKEIHFAWDTYSDKDEILKKLELFSEYSHKPHTHNSIVYTLVNYNTTFDQDLERIYTLRKLGYWAYITIYDKEHCDQKYIDLSRWVNNRFVFSKCEKFEDYKR